MTHSVYVGATSSELADVRRLLVDQIGSAGTRPVMLDESERRAARAGDACIGVIAYWRGLRADLGERGL